MNITDKHKKEKMCFILNALKSQVHDKKTMIAQIIDLHGKNSYLILIACLLSLRAKDTQTLPIAIKLFNIIKTPQQMISISQNMLEEIIYSLGFYKKKAEILKCVSQELIIRFNSIVPHTKEELLSIKGIGIKTAALVLSEGFDIPAICVDTHVLRLCNHWNLIHTSDPAICMRELENITPHERWREINHCFVLYGQHFCSSQQNSLLRCKTKNICQSIIQY